MASLVSSLTNAIAPIASKAMPNMDAELAKAKVAAANVETGVEAYAITTVTLQTLSTIAMLGMFWLALQKHRSGK